jgi:hypothetical protein
LSGGFGPSWSLDVAEGGYVHHSSLDASATHAVAPSTDWLHVRIRVLPNGSAATSEVTIIDHADVSTTTKIAVAEVGRSMFFGAVAGSTGPVDVYLDDVTCQISDPPVP